MKRALIFSDAAMDARVFPPRTVATVALGPAALRRCAGRLHELVPEHLNMLSAECRAAGVALSSAVKRKSELLFFREFCATLALDFDSFGAAGVMTLSDEEHVLSLFAVFVVHYPRQTKKVKSGGLNTAKYAEDCLSAVRAYCYARHGRIPGPEARSARQLSLVLKGLHKRAPSGRRALRSPILQVHLRAIRKLLNLEDSPLDRMIWAFFLTCWQGACRCGDLLRGKRYAGSQAWCPQFDTHRGRLAFSHVDGTSGVLRATLRLKPGKTDPTGEKGFEKTFLVDESPDSLSAGAALLDMLIRDGVAGDRTLVPLFLDPRTGRELTYVQAAADLRRLLLLAGFPELSVGMHSLRIGGATCCASVGGEYVSGCLGVWQSKCRRKYMYAMRECVEETCWLMARAAGGELSVRPGPVSCLG